MLVHGIGASSRYLMPLAERLAESHPVYVPDLPGFGRSAKPRNALPLPALAEVLVEWMDAVGIRRPVMAGNSFGCEVIAETAVRFPDRVGAAVFLGPTVDRHNRTARQQVWRAAVTAFHEPPSLAWPLAQDYLQAGVRRPWQTLRFALKDPIEAKLPSISAPVLVMRGEHDAITTQRWAEEVAALPQGELAIVEDGAHVLNYDSAPAVAAAIERFVARIAADGGWQAAPHDG